MSIQPALSTVAVPPGLADSLPQRCLSVVTRLAPDVTPAAVADIFKRTRDRHRRLGVNGVMLFDGERFAYLLCGAAAEVSEAFDHVMGDARQALPLMLADADKVPTWAARPWRSGWTEPDALGALAASAGPHDAHALQTWQHLIVNSDLL